MVNRFRRWVCSWLYIFGIIVMIVGIGIAIFTSWTIVGLGAGAVIFAIGCVIFILGLICRYV